jgi:hypothetical protein
MKRRKMIQSLGVLFATSSVVILGKRAHAAEYKYKCVRNGKIHTYSRKGNYKCPDHSNHNLIPVN